MNFTNNTLEIFDEILLKIEGWYSRKKRNCLVDRSKLPISHKFSAACDEGMYDRTL